MRQPTQTELQAMMKQKQSERLLEDLRTVLQSRAGRSVFCWLLDVCRLNELSFTGNSQTFLYEGMRKVGLELLSRTLMLPDGLDLKQMAEQEYRRRGNEILMEIQEKMREEE